MNFMSVGDLAGHFTNRLNTAAVKIDLLRLNNELSTGRPADRVAFAGGDTARLSLIERDIVLAQTRVAAGTSLAQFLSGMQTALDGMEALRAGLGAQIQPLNNASSSLEIARTSDAGASTFRDLVAQLNSTVAGSSLFAGTAVDRPALADAEVMLASLRAGAAGSTTATDVIVAVDTWFDDPAGGFATVGYLGDAGPPIMRSIDAGMSMTVEPRADQPAIKRLLRTAAIVALAADPALALPLSTQRSLVTGALSDLLSATAPLTDLRAVVGLEEERLADAKDRNGALAAALTVMRNELALVDPYATAVALKEKETQLEMQFSLTARLSGLSLVRFL
jgi:flagellar hook-associated protein 3 FlgL